MTIHFTLDVVDSEHLTGKLHSTVPQNAMTCNMDRGYELSFVH